MKIIFHCFGGAHSSVTAAALYLKLIPDTRSALPEELLALPYYEAQMRREHGRIRFMGYDRLGNEVYVVGKKNMGNHYERLMRRIITLCGAGQEQFLFVGTMPYVNLWMMIGGFLSRRLGLVNPGRRIVIHGTRKAYPRFLQLAKLLQGTDFSFAGQAAKGAGK